MRQPVIFIGMHRSGTSMLGRSLDSLGLFSGIQKDGNHEALFFLRLNEWMLAQCGGRWDTPLAIEYLWDKEDVLAWIEEYVRYLLDSPKAIQFLGLRRYLMTGGITKLDIPWGWKDPRNTFTLPFWLRIFPNAKVLYIERHGVDVAQSLRVRSLKGLIITTRKYQRYKKLTPLIPKRGGFIESPRCASLQDGFSLWKDYVSQANRVMKSLPQDRVLKLKYEEVLQDPVQYLRMSTSFCGNDVSDAELKLVAKGINSSRAYSYLNDPELRDFAIHHQLDLTEIGY